MDFLAILMALLTTGSMIVMSIMVSFCGSMAIVAVYYSFIKRLLRAQALSKTFKKLKNGATQLLSGHEREGKEQGSTFNTRVYLSSFKESLSLSKKDYKRIFIVSLSVFVLIFVPFIILTGIEVQKKLQGMDLKQLMNSDPALFAVHTLFSQLVFLIVVLVAFSLPVVLVLYGILNQCVKKRMKRLETFA